ncbi:hypothetical protein ACFC34_37485 [Streptomyces sp. NPDC056053]|uniref:hypothetical protein n=1 Tax=Streptomyces sp. NPDC056053 TaxID=3345696 RepID=UPI0035E34C66
MDVYRAVLGRVGADLRYDLEELIKTLDSWYPKWAEGRGTWWAEDGSVLFSITG